MSNCLETEVDGVMVRMYYEPNPKTPSGNEFVGITTLSEDGTWEWEATDSDWWLYGEEVIENPTVVEVEDAVS